MKNKFGTSLPEKHPETGDYPYIFDLMYDDVLNDNNVNVATQNYKNNIIRDFKERDDFGKNKYGTRLQPFNGRDAIVDCGQEIIDSMVYIRQRLYEVNYLIRNSDESNKTIDLLKSERDFLFYMYKSLYSIYVIIKKFYESYD